MPAPAKRSAPAASNCRQRTPKARSTTRQRISAPQSRCSTCSSSTDRAGVSFSTVTGQRSGRRTLAFAKRRASPGRAAQSSGKTDEVFNPRRTSGLPAPVQVCRTSKSKALRKAAYTAAAIPAGPAPTIAKSTSCDGQCFQIPASRASSCNVGFTRIRRSHIQITGVFRGEACVSKKSPSRCGFRVEPGKWDKVLVKKLANRIRIAAASWTNNTSPIVPN